MAVFVDTGAWFAYFVRRDPDHRAATRWMQRNRQPLVTTDYILDELLTLLKVREYFRVAVAAGEARWQQQVAWSIAASACTAPRCYRRGASA
jgi:predicted nucleic acid-binding protein